MKIGRIYLIFIKYKSKNSKTDYLKEKIGLDMRMYHTIELESD